MLTPVQDLMADLPDPQADALRAALGWGPATGTAGTPGDRYLIAAATLSLLAAAADAKPLLVVVDDLHWADSESAAALLFAARRMRHDAVAFLFAVRTGSEPTMPLSGLDVVSLTGLTSASAAQMLPETLASGVLARLVDQTHGNPLALSAIAERLNTAQRLGASALPDPLPVHARLELAYEPLLRELSPSAMWAVLLFAAAQQDAVAAAPIAALRENAEDAGSALDEAEERGVLVRDRGGIRFRHPLLRSAAWAMAAPAQRRAAHRALAAALPGDAARAARSWHLAEASSGPDDALADDLEDVADEERTRRGFASGSAALERAALLTRDPERAADRLAAAAGDAFLAGDLERTRMLADRVLAGPASAAARASVLSTLGVLEQYAGSVPRAADRLAAAADLARGAQRVWALSELGATRFRLNDLAGLAECADRIAAVADLDDPEQRMLVDFMGGFASTVLGQPAAGRPLLTRALEALLSPPLRDDPRYLTHLLLVAAFRGDIDAILVIEAAAETRLALARERGALGVLVPALSLMAAGHAILGDHRRAFADAGEAAELGEQLGYVADTAVAVEMLAWQSAARGLHDDARRALAQATALTDRAGTTAYHAHHAITAGFCALSRGDPAEAVAVLEKRIAVDGGVGSMGEPLGIAPDLIEAYVGMGRLPDAAALARRYAAETPQPAPKSTEALISRSLALTADTLEEAESAFEAALAAHNEAYDAFEAARTRLLFGARLRRAGRRVAAREQLRSAVDAFTAMDLTAWQQRAAAELAATGASLRTAGHATTEPLTSQETRVALLVARGLSNKEVAAALFLSPKTIEHHLAGVFRKRGFRSRTELARAMATEPASGVD